ncbi:hypothetical protein K0U83_13745 [bacterium]|nr:hypothetical protein [bacterium]
MPADYSITTINKLLKVLQSDKESTDLILNDFPTFGMIKKINDFVGENYQFALSGAGGQGISPDFASAIDNSTASNDLKPIVTRGQMYGYATVTRAALLAADGKKGGYQEIAKKIKKDLDRGMRRAIGALLMGDGGGAFGQLAASTTLASTQLRLRDPNSVVFFEKGMKLQLSSTNGVTGTVRAGFLTVTAVDRDNGYLTVDANISTGITTPTVDDYVFVQGYHANSFGQVVITGIPGWIPKAAPSPGESFFGIDRSVDPFRFAGVRYLAGGASIKQALLLGLTKGGREGANPRVIGMNPMDLGAFADSLDNKADTVRLKASGADVGYDAISIVSPTQSGRISLYGDSSISVGDAWALDFDDWEFHSLGYTSKVPELIQVPGEGGYMERIATRDAYAVRYGALGNLICRNPANQIYIKLPTAP